MPEVMTNDRLEALRAYNASELPLVEKDLAAELATRERLFEAPAEFYRVPLVHICSIWPKRVVWQGVGHGGVGLKRYVLEPGSPQKPFILPLQNTYVLIQTIGETKGEGGFSVGYQPAPVLAAQIARDIILQETGNHVANVRGKKGIGIIAGPKATAAELKELFEFQEQFLKYIVERADQFDDANQRHKITSEHREALTMLALDENQHKWYRSRVQQYNACPICSERILAETRVCKHCGPAAPYHGDLVKFFMDSGEVPSSEQWPSIAKAIDKLTAKGK